jgi:hypothetical protein
LTFKTYCPIHYSEYLQLNVALLFRYGKYEFVIATDTVYKMQCKMLWNLVQCKLMFVLKKKVS